MFQWAKKICETTSIASSVLSRPLKFTKWRVIEQLGLRQRNFYTYSTGTQPILRIKLRRTGLRNKRAAVYVLEHIVRAAMLTFASTRQYHSCRDEVMRKKTVMTSAGDVTGRLPPGSRSHRGVTNPADFFTRQDLNTFFLRLAARAVQCRMNVMYE
jgi:hypothetical protein